MKSSQLFFIFSIAITAPHMDEQMAQFSAIACLALAMLFFAAETLLEARK